MHPCNFAGYCKGELIPLIARCLFCYNKRHKALIVLYAMSACSQIYL